MIVEHSLQTMMSMLNNKSQEHYRDQYGLQWFTEFLFAFLMFVLGVILYGILVLLLWNACLVPLTGVHKCTNVWQMVGVIIAVRLIIGM